MKRFVMAMAAVVLASAIPSQIAAAATTCSYSPSSHRVDVSLVGSVISTMYRDTAGHIILDGNWCGGAATVTNTDHINVNGGLSSQSFTIDLRNKGFKPGFSNEPGKSDEIEFTINLGADLDALSVGGTNNVDKIDFGQSSVMFVPVRRINLNSGESTHLDSDVTFSGVEQLVVSAQGGNDVIRARGLRGTGPDPITVGIRVYGGPGDDIIKGGEYVDELVGQTGKDKIWGFGAADEINQVDGQGGDIAYGGGATDFGYGDPGDSFTQ